MIRLIDVYENERPRPGAVDLLYRLLAERPSAAGISHHELPSIEQHTAFVASRPYRIWCLVEAAVAEGEWSLVGAVSATRQNEIGIAILKAHQRHGYAAQAITQMCLEHLPLPAVTSQRPGCWVANVAPQNEPSHALFRGLGAKVRQITYEL